MIQSPVNNSQSGVILIAVLWITTLLALLVAGFTSAVLGDAREVANRADLVRVQALAEAGVARASLGLLENLEENRWIADGRQYDFTVDGLEVTLSILDENGRIDLNKANEPLLQSLITRIDIEQEERDALLAAILDWRDSDDAKLVLGAEDRDYKREGAPHGAGDAPFIHVSQLRNVLGVTEDVYDAMLPVITINSRSGRLNPITATRDTLNLLPGIDAGILETLFALRAEVPVDLAAVRATLAGDTALLDFNSGPIFTVTIMGELESGLSFSREAVIWLQPDDKAAYRIVEWREPQIPASLLEDWATLREEQARDQNPAAESTGGTKESG